MMSDWMKTVERGLLAAERALLSALLVILVGLSFLQVVLRGGFSAGLLWADVFLRHLVLLIGFLGAAVAVSEGKMFSFDAAAHILRGRIKTFAALLVQGFAAAMAAALAAAAWIFFLNEYHLGGTLFTVGSFSVPSWVSAIVVPCGFALVFIHCVLRAAAALGRPSPEGAAVLPSPKGALGTPEK